MENVNMLPAAPQQPGALGGEPEVFEAHGWVQTHGPAINAFTQEFDIAEEWAMAGYRTAELLNREHVDAEIERLVGEHQTHVARLQAEVERLHQSHETLHEVIGRHRARNVALEGLLHKATAFVQDLRDAAGSQPSVATGYLQDILDELSSVEGAKS